MWVRCIFSGYEKQRLPLLNVVVVRRKTGHMASARTLQYASPWSLWTIGNPYRNNCVIRQVAPSIVLILAIMSALNLVCLMEGGQDVCVNR
jgi:hypothetical protein